MDKTKNQSTTPPTLSQFLDDYFNKREYELLPLAGDASTRKYYRVVQGDKSWVLMSWDPFTDVENYPFLSVQRHFKNCSITVPEVVRTAPQLGLVLLEDLGDLTLERKFWENQNQELALPYYLQTIDELIKIHYHATRHTGPCTAFQIAFDTKKFMWEMNYGREHLIEKLGQVALSSKSSQELEKIFLNICESLDKEPKWVAHRDYHSRNVMIKLGKVRIIDFQDARLGPIQYDLVSLLYDSYVQLAEPTRTKLLNYYLTSAAGFLPTGFSRSRFDELMKIQILQRCFKACGSFSSFYNTRQDRRYLKYIQPTLQLVAVTLEDFPQYKVFQQILADNNILNRNYAEMGE